MPHYPADIDPDSGPRLPLPERSHLDADVQSIFDMYTQPGTNSIRGLRGPAGLQLHSPELAKRNRPVGRYLRTEAGFAGRVREVAILTTARCCESPFEWAAHEAEALKEGVPRTTIEAIRAVGSLEDVDEQDAIVIQLGREMFRARRVTSPTYSRALAQFGTRQLVDLV